MACDTLLTIPPPDCNGLTMNSGRAGPMGGEQIRGKGGESAILRVPGGVFR